MEKNQQENREITKETRQTIEPEVFTNNMYTPAFLRSQIGKLVRVEFLIGTNNITDRIGILEDVGISYILLRSIESGNILYCDIYSIKFITISTTAFYGTMNGAMGGTMNSNMMNNRFYPGPGMPNF